MAAQRLVHCSRSRSWRVNGCTGWPGEAQQALGAAHSFAPGLSSSQLMHLWKRA